jgi:hypothetical protein
VLHVQTTLLDGAVADNEPLLHVAVLPLLSRSDYANIITECTIVDCCGYLTGSTRWSRSSRVATAQN